MKDDGGRRGSAYSIKSLRELPPRGTCGGGWTERLSPSRRLILIKKSCWVPVFSLRNVGTSVTGCRRFFSPSVSPTSGVLVTAERRSTRGRGSRPRR